MKTAERRERCERCDQVVLRVSHDFKEPIVSVQHGWPGEFWYQCQMPPGEMGKVELPYHPRHFLIEQIDGGGRRLSWEKSPVPDTYEQVVVDATGAIRYLAKDAT